MESKLTNSDLAELLALEAEATKSPTAGKALRKASRRALSWEVEAHELWDRSRPLTELEGIGPFISKILAGWFAKRPSIPDRNETRRDFLTLTEARAILKTKPAWKSSYKGDLQMHTTWSDGSATLAEMAEAAIAR